MKRIYESIPLASVLYHVGGLEKIRVIDYDHYLNRYLPDNVSEIVFEGKYNDGRKLLDQNRKYTHAELHELTVDGDTLVLGICTRLDRN